MDKIYYENLFAFPWRDAVWLIWYNTDTFKIVSKSHLMSYVYVFDRFFDLHKILTNVVIALNELAGKILGDCSNCLQTAGSFGCAPSITASYL
jgi:hypothetical protein